MYVAAIVGFEPATFRTEGNEHNHWATYLNGCIVKIEFLWSMVSVHDRYEGKCLD